MSALEQVRAELAQVAEALPYYRADEFAARMEAVIGQVTPLLHTSQHQQRIVGQLEQVKLDGRERINAGLTRIAETITNVGTTW